MANTTKTYLDLAGLTYYDGKIKGWVNDKVDALDVAEFALASKDGTTNVVTIHGISETNGKIAVGSATANDVALAAVAATGAAADVSYSNTIGSTAVTNVDDALDALVSSTSGGVASKTVYITTTAGGSGDAYSKRYGVYQGSTGSSSSPVVGEHLADIDIPKDMVVEDGEVVDIVYVSTDNSLHEGTASGTDVTAEIKGAGVPATSADEGKYIKLTIANATSSHLWIKATDLVDIYTAASGATQVQLAISASNEISASLVAGGVGTTELAASSVTAAKMNIAAHTESQTASTDGLALSVTTTNGEVSAVSGSIAANTYEPYGAAATAINALDVTGVDIAKYTAGTLGAADTLVLPATITETDGLIGAGADTVTLETITQTDIDALF